MSDPLEKRLYITADVDWACDGVLTDTLDLFDRLNIPLTLFITHETPLLGRMRADPLITLGVHPNFVPQLQNTAPQSFQKTLADIKALVPEAHLLRCHALVDATPVLSAAHEMGFTRDLNLFIPFSSGITLRPFRHFSGIRRVPYFYEDDAWCLEPDPASAQTHLLQSGGLRIFNFHPIHLFLNTEKTERYNQAKPYYQDFEGLKPFVNPDQRQGARAFLMQLVECAAANGFSFGRVEEL